MYEYIEGKIAELNPSFVVVETHGIGYFVSISLNTYAQLQGATNCKLFLHQVIREDAHTLFGFSERGEREMFRLLIGVSGVGSTTANMLLSTMHFSEIQQAILVENLAALKAVKGIGLKTAQRIILDLKDKVAKVHFQEGSGVLTVVSAVVEEASLALVMLGFNKKLAEKVLQKITKENPTIGVESLVKQALKEL